MRRRKTEGSHRDSQLPRKKGNWVFIQMGSGKKQLKIIAATSMTIFSLLTCFMGAYAWFNSASQKSSDADGFNVYAGSSLNIISAYAVRYDGTYGAIAIDISGGNKGISMSEYDYIFTDRNVNTPVFLRLEITGYQSENNLTVTIPCTGEYSTDGTAIDPNLSNVVCAKFLRGLKADTSPSTPVTPDTYTWTGDNVTSSAVINSYKGMLANTNAKKQDETLQNPGTPYIVSKSKPSKTITLTLPAADVFNPSFLVDREDKNGNTVKAAVVYIALDYYVDVASGVNLVEDYIKSYGSGERSSSFASDIQSMTLGNEGSGS